MIGRRRRPRDHNFDIYSPTFQEILKLLPRDRRFFVSCASGGRSTNAVGQMQALGFHTVWDLDGGFSYFSSFPEHADLVE